MQRAALGREIGVAEAARFEERPTHNGRVRLDHLERKAAFGQAVAHLTVQARALGLHVRQFRAFDRDGLHADFGVPPHWEVATMCAVGRALEPVDGPPVRERRDVSDLLWPTC